MFSKNNSHTLKYNDAYHFLRISIDVNNFIKFNY